MPRQQDNNSGKVLSYQDAGKSIEEFYLVSFIDGSHHKSLHGHLKRHMLRPFQYQVKFSLPWDYPMECWDTARKRASRACNLRKFSKHHAKYWQFLQQDFPGGAAWLEFREKWSRDLNEARLRGCEDFFGSNDEVSVVPIGSIEPPLTVINPAPSVMLLRAGRTSPTNSM